MKRSAVNQAYRDALACFARHRWALPPSPRWDITDFGLGDFDRNGLALVNLANEPEYCEKLMFARRNQATPCHMHARKKEDIICRAGELALQERVVAGTVLAATVQGCLVVVGAVAIGVTPATWPGPIGPARRDREPGRACGRRGQVYDVTAWLGYPAKEPRANPSTMEPMAPVLPERKR